MAEVSWPRPLTLPRAAELRGRARTTPGRLRLAMVILVAATALAAIVAGATTSVRRDAADAVAMRDEPLMVDADGLYASLSDADAAAAATFLTGGVESPALRRRYAADLHRASLQLTQLARRVQGSPASTAALAGVASQLPVYSGLVESARANNRQGFPVGAAYLRQASDLMRRRILPAAGRLYAVEARRVGDQQARGTSLGGVVSAAVAFALLLALLVAVQVLLARRVHRILNVGLAAATAVLLVLTVLVLAGLLGARSAMAIAHRDGSDSVQVLSAARILALRAEADENLALVARGGGDVYLNDFAVVTKALEPPNGLLGEARRLAARTGTTAAADGLTTTWRDLRVTHGRVVSLQAAGRFDDAVALAVGPRAREAALADTLDRRLAGAIGDAQRRFERSAQDARSSLNVLAVAIPLLALAAALLLCLGLQQRVKEYR